MSVNLCVQNIHIFKSPIALSGPNLIHISIFQEIELYDRPVKKKSKTEYVKKSLVFAVLAMYVFSLTYIHTDNVTDRQDERGRGGITP